MKYPGLQHQPNHSDSGRVVPFIRGFLRTQFGRPTGFWGNVAGSIMARTPSNNGRIQLTLSLLDIQPHDRILEIGFGPGIAIQQVSRFTEAGFIAGVDHSEVMVRQAAKRNARAIRDGKVVLRLGSASNLPKFDQPFDKIFTINSIHFWTDPANCLKELRKLLRPGGLMVVTIQPRSRSATDATTKIIGEEIAGHLKRAGFSECRLQIRRMNPVSVACVLGTK